MIILPDQPFNYYLTLAAEFARRSEHSMYKMGAVIMDRNVMLACGWNKNKTHPMASNYTRKIHAELAALLSPRLARSTTWYRTGNKWAILGSLKGANMYVARLTNGGSLATSRPCKDCMILISETGLKSVTFIDENGRICHTKL